MTCIIFVLAANLPALATIPATVYGYASTAAFALLATKLDTLTGLSMKNPALMAGVSLVIGAFYGYACEKLALMMIAGRQRCRTPDRRPGQPAGAGSRRSGACHRVWVGG